MRTCTSRSLPKCPSRACAPSSGAASTALVPPRLAGKSCTLRLSRVAGLPGKGEFLLLLQRRARRGAR
eukprot:6050336-Alexandrium_andersonii.AAC.1